jgi:branched-chain amino acid transport system permease protein
MEVVAGYINEILTLAIFAVSFNLLAGYSGQLSVAHPAFGAIAGYTLAYLFLTDDLSFALGAGLGIAFATAGGLLVGAVVMRLSSEWLMLLTFAVQVTVISLVTTSADLGGTYGLQGVTGLTVLGLDLGEPSTALPVFAFLALVVYALCHRVGESPYGRVLRGIREDEVATRALGKNVSVYKLTVFALTAGMAGVGGVLVVVQNTVASPATFSVALAVLIVSAVVVGGMGNLPGSVFASALIVLSTPFLEDVVQLDPTTASLWRFVVYGILLVAVLFWRPQGLLPRGLGRRARRTAEGEATPPRPAPRSESSNSSSPRPLAADSEPVLEVRGLDKRFGGILAADQVDFTLRRGTITALVGPNGAGKTTLFNLLTGVIPPDRGVVRLNGRNVVGMTPDRIARLGMVRSFQDVRVFLRLTAVENVMLAISGQAGERIGPLLTQPLRVVRNERETRERAMGWLGSIGLEHLADVPTADLAFGQQKLLALVRALATETDVLLLDEPASAVDADWLEPIVDLIQRCREGGRTICIVEHNLQVVERVADSVTFMELGRITAEGAFADLTAEPRLAEAYFGT